MSRSLYVYGLVPSAVLLQDGDVGTGIASSPVRLVQAGELHALVSDITPGSVAPTRRNMIAHTSVLERATARGDVLPLRFGTVAPGAPALMRCILVNAQRFAAAFAGIAGRVELGLKASWREGIVFAEIIAADAELTRMRDRLRRLPASETYYERVELGRRVEAALTERRQSETASILAGLSPLAVREVALRTADEDMIFNRAFLVRREDEAGFDAAIQAIGEQSGVRVNFRYVGPVPPYNFVDLQLNWLTEAA